MRDRTSSLRLRTDFNLLASADEVGGVRAVVTDACATSWGSARLAVDERGHTHLLLPVPAGTEVKSDRRSRGVHVGGLTLLEDDAERSFVSVACLQPSLFDVFVHVAVDVAAAVSSAPDAPGTMALGVLGRWRQLLDRHRSPEPSVEMVLGAWGEMQHLIMLQRAGAREAGLWSGPSGARWDFMAPGLAIEVKTTRARHELTAEIHSIDQLELSGDTRLALSVLRVEAAPGGESVPDLVEALVAEGADSLDLFRCLDAIGVGPDRFTDIEELRFKTLEHVAWLVDEHFPRLTRASFVGGQLPDGVVLRGYEVKLDLIRSRALSDDAWSAFLAQFAGT